MNQGQDKFLQFILERVQAGKQEEAKALLMESFSKQADGTFNAEYLQLFMPQVIALLKTEHIEEVKNIMTQFENKKV